MGTKIKTTFDGEEHEFEVRPVNSNPLEATHFITKGGEIRSYEESQSHWGLGISIRDEPGVYLRLILPRHEFGGVVYEETGEVRFAQPNEYYLNNSILHCRMKVFGETISKYTILRPVGS